MVKQFLCAMQFPEKPISLTTWKHLNLPTKQPMQDNKSGLAAEPLWLLKHTV